MGDGGLRYTSGEGRGEELSISDWQCAVASLQPSLTNSLASPCLSEPDNAGSGRLRNSRLEEQDIPVHIQSLRYRYIRRRGGGYS